MNCFDLEIYKNKLENRKDMNDFIWELIHPLESTFIRGNTRLHLSNKSSGAVDEVSQIEGFTRILWGASVLEKNEKSDALWEKLRLGLIHGTDPEHEDYFGVVPDYNQKIVEMASIAFALVINPKSCYEPLSKIQKNNLISWLDQINVAKAYDCNWKFFRVMVNIAFKSLGLSYNVEQMNAYLTDIDEYYVKDGWYKDGDFDNSHADYYVPFAMHYYGLFYSVHMNDVDPKRCKIYRERAREFAEEFVYWFAKNGEAIPYGRSLTYRFAQVAFWSMIVVADVETSFSLGQVKGLILRHLRWWNSQPIYDRDGIMTIGYAYENSFMGEDYNAPGSVYWSMKTLVIAGLPPEHPFWKTKELELPLLPSRKMEVVPRMVIVRDEKSSHVLAYNGGNYHTNWHTHVEYKYEKFVYSTFFGFSVPKSHKRLFLGGYDSTLAVSIDGSYYRHKDKSDEIVLSEEIIKIKWKPFEGTDIETQIIIGHPWHIRIHKISSKQKVYTADGGFAIGLEGPKGKPYVTHTEEKKGRVIVSTEQGYSMMEDISLNQEGNVIGMASNTNIMNPRTSLPTLVSVCEPGNTILISFVSGDYGVYDKIKKPSICYENQKLTVIDEKGKQIYIIEKK